MQTMWSNTAWPMNRMVQSSRFWMTPGGFLSGEETCLASLFETAFVRSSSAIVRSQISGIWGRHCHNLLLSCVSVSNQFSFKISLRQSLIPLSALTCGFLAILPSLTYLDKQILLALDHLIPRVSVQLLSSLKWHLQRPWLFFRGVQMDPCSTHIVFTQMSRCFDSIFHDVIFAYRKFHGWSAASLQLTEE